MRKPAGREHSGRRRLANGLSKQHRGTGWQASLGVPAGFRAVCAKTEARQIGYVLLAALTLLALLEHWFMVLPLAHQKLRRWMIPAQKTKPAKATPLLDSLKEYSHGL